jgi:F-type H+-transporting ATPase subunit epsilon
MMTLLGTGELRLGTGGSAGRFRLEGGFLQVINDNVRVVTEKAEKSSG